MDFQHFFDSRGNWIAFRRGKFVFDPNGKWIGWLPWDNDEIVDPCGEYLGTIVNQSRSRLYHFRNRPYLGYPGYPGHPGYPGYPGYPGFAGYDMPPLGAEDVKIVEEERA